MPPIPQPTIETTHLHRKKIITMSAIVIVVLVVIVLIALAARTAQRNAAFEAWYQGYQQKMSESSLKEFGESLKDTTPLSEKGRQQYLQKQLEAFAASLPKSSDVGTSATATATIQEESLRAFGTSIDQTRNALRKLYFESH